MTRQFIKKFAFPIFLFLFISVVSAVGAAADTSCSGTVSSDLKIHVPSAGFAGAYYAFDLEYVPSNDGLVLFRMTDISSVDGTCAGPAVFWLTDDKILLHMPSLVYDSIHFWADFEYLPTYDGQILFKLVDFSIPLAGVVTLDAERQKSALVSAEKGGTITATANDGTVFTLTVPAKALLVDETITLTPVTSVDGMPLSGGMKATVQMAPEGLRLLQSATLTINLPSTVDPAQLISFAYLGTGNDLHQYPATVNGSTITMSINHFSGVGLGTGTQADKDAVSGRKPSAAEAQAEQTLSGLIDQDKKTSPDGLMHLTDDQLDPIFRQWYNASVLPQLTTAETDDTNFPCAVSEFFAWDRAMFFLNNGGAVDTSLPFTGSSLQDRFYKERDRSFQSIAKGFNNAFNKSAERCVNNNDPFEAGVMLSLARQYTLLGLGDTKFNQKYGQWFTFENAIKKVEQCARFQVTFDSTIVRTQPNQGPTFTYQYQATADMYLESDILSPFVSDLAPVQAKITGCGPGGCVDWFSDTAAENLRFKVFSLSMAGLTGRSLVCGEAAKKPAFEVSLKYNFASLDPTCPDCDLYVPENADFWRFYYNQLHLDDYSRPHSFENWFDAYYTATDFVSHSVDAPGIIAKKEYVQDKAVGLDGLSETTLFTIVHKPK